MYSNLEDQPFLDRTWEFVTKKGLCSSLVWQFRRELFSCLCAVPFLHTYLGASIGKNITASDASNTGGAVGVANEWTTEGSDFVTAVTSGNQPKRVPVLVVSLFNGIL